MATNRSIVVLMGILMCLIFLGASHIVLAQEKILKAYGPGGPLGPLKECAEIFSKENNVKVEVVAGPTPKWIEQAKQDADIIFGGAEYMLTEFVQKYPGLVDEKTRTSLYIWLTAKVITRSNVHEI